MRNLNELYTIVLNHYQSLLKNDENKSLLFICNCIENANKNSIITDEEFDKIKKHFETQYPTSEINSEFITDISSSFISHRGKVESAWWLLVGDEYFKKGVAIRIKFLKKMIKITK